MATSRSAAATAAIATFASIANAAPESSRVTLGRLSNPVGQVPGTSCKEYFPAFGSSFDLSPATSSTFYLVSDDRNNQNSSDFSYFFNVCANVAWDVFPDQYKTICNWTFPGDNRQTIDFAVTGNAPAFQINNKNKIDKYNLCHRLGSDVTANGGNTKPAALLLADKTNPSLGVGVQYFGGDNCTGTPSEMLTQRSMRVWFMCYNDQGNVPREETVLESSMCVYDVFIYSAYGCPLECPLVVGPDGGKRLCSGHGVCDYDQEATHSKCFCNDGYVGSDCGSTATPPSSGLSAVGFVLLAVVLLLVGAMGFLIHVWFRIRGLRLDPTAYSALRGGPETDGAIAASQE